MFNTKWNHWNDRQLVERRLETVTVYCLFIFYLKNVSCCNCMVINNAPLNFDVVIGVVIIQLKTA